MSALPADYHELPQRIPEPVPSDPRFARVAALRRPIPVGREGAIAEAFDPVFPPDRSTELEWLRQAAAGPGADAPRERRP